MIRWLLEWWLAIVRAALFPFLWATGLEAWSVHVA